jgi:hypothetical protein
VPLSIQEKIVYMRLSGRRVAMAASSILGAASLAMLSAPQANAETFFNTLTNGKTNMSITATSLNDRAPVVQQFTTSFNFNQQWQNINNSDGSKTYQLRQKIRTASGTFVNGCLDLASDANRADQVSGAQLVVRTCDGTTSQKWIRRFDLQSKPGFNPTENALSRMYWDITSTANNTAVVQKKFSGLSQQSWAVFGVASLP